MAAFQMTTYGRFWVFTEGRRAAGLGGAPEAFRETRPDPPPGENATGGVPPAASGHSTHTGPVLRHAGLHSLLGAVPDGPLGSAAQDGLGSSQSGAAAHGPVVPSPHRHERVAAQQAALNQQLRGHYQYYGVTGNAPALATFHRQVARRWRTWLSRRSRAAHLSWEAFRRRLRHYPLAPPRVVHSTYRRAASP